MKLASLGGFESNYKKRVTFWEDFLFPFPSVSRWSEKLKLLEAQKKVTLTFNGPFYRIGAR